jgi:hypothetical protein
MDARPGTETRRNVLYVGPLSDLWNATPIRHLLCCEQFTHSFISFAALLTCLAQSVFGRIDKERRRGIPSGSKRNQMYQAFPEKPYRQRAKMETIFSMVRRELSWGAPGHSPSGQIRQALLLGLAYLKLLWEDVNRALFFLQENPILKSLVLISLRSLPKGSFNNYCAFIELRTFCKNTKGRGTNSGRWLGFFDGAARTSDFNGFSFIKFAKLGAVGEL